MVGSKTEGDSSAAIQIRSTQSLEFKYEASSLSHYVGPAQQSNNDSGRDIPRLSRRGSSRQQLPIDEINSYTDQYYENNKVSSSHKQSAAPGSNGPKPTDGNYLSAYRSTKQQEPFTFANSLQHSESKHEGNGRGQSFNEPESNGRTNNPYLSHTKKSVNPKITASRQLAPSDGNRGVRAFNDQSNR